MLQKVTVWTLYYILVKVPSRLKCTRGKNVYHALTCSTLNPLRKLRSCLEDSAHSHETSTCQNQHARKHPHVSKATAIQDPSTNGCAEQQADRNDTEALSHACSNESSVGRQVHEHSRWQRHQSSREEAIQHTLDDNRCFAADRNEAECNNSRDHTARDDHVHRSRAISDEIGHDATKHRSRVDDRQRVECQALRRDVVGDAVALNVEEGSV